MLTKKLRFFGARSTSRLVYIGAQGALRKILGSVGRKWISEKLSKGGPFGSAGGRIPEGGGGGGGSVRTPPPPPLPPKSAPPPLNPPLVVFYLVGKGSLQSIRLPTFEISGFFQEKKHSHSPKFEFSIFKNRFHNIVVEN